MSHWKTWMVLAALATTSACDGDDTTDTDDSEDTDESMDSEDSGDSGDSGDSKDSGDTGGDASEYVGSFEACGGHDSTDLATSCGTKQGDIGYYADGSAAFMTSTECDLMSWWDDGMDNLEFQSCDGDARVAFRYAVSLETEGSTVYLVQKPAGYDGTLGDLREKIADTPPDMSVCDALTKKDLQCSSQVAPGTPAVHADFNGEWQGCTGTDATDDDAIKTSCASTQNSFIVFDSSANTSKSILANGANCVLADAVIADYPGASATYQETRNAAGEWFAMSQGPVEIKTIESVRYLLIHGPGGQLQIAKESSANPTCTGTTDMTKAGSTPAP